MLWLCWTWRAEGQPEQQGCASGGVSGGFWWQRGVSKRLLFLWDRIPLQT